MKSIWNWVQSRDHASMRLLCIFSLLLNYWGLCAAKNPDVKSFDLWLGVGMYATSVLALFILVLALTQPAKK